MKLISILFLEISSNHSNLQQQSGKLGRTCRAVSSIFGCTKKAIGPFPAFLNGSPSHDVADMFRILMLSSLSNSVVHAVANTCRRYVQDSSGRNGPVFHCFHNSVQTVTHPVYLNHRFNRFAHSARLGDQGHFFGMCRANTHFRNSTPLQVSCKQAASMLQVSYE